MSKINKKINEHILLEVEHWGDWVIDFHVDGVLIKSGQKTMAIPHEVIEWIYRKVEEG